MLEKKTFYYQKLKDNSKINHTPFTTNHELLTDRVTQTIKCFTNKCLIW